MKQEKIKLINNIGYGPWETESYQLYILGFFLSEMTPSVWPRFYDIFRNPMANGLSSQLLTIRKINNNIFMYLDFDYEKYEKEPEEYLLTIQIPELLSVMEQWRDVTKSMPPFVIITEDNGKYTLNAANE